jgi:hypothetical protein
MMCAEMVQGAESGHRWLSGGWRFFRTLSKLPEPLFEVGEFNLQFEEPSLGVRRELVQVSFCSLNHRVFPINT